MKGSTIAWIVGLTWFFGGLVILVVAEGRKSWIVWFMRKAPPDVTMIQGAMLFAWLAVMPLLLMVAALRVAGRVAVRLGSAIGHAFRKRPAG